MLEQALRGSRLLYAYTMYFDAPVEAVFRYTGDPAYWAHDFDGKPLERLTLSWDGREYAPGSRMTLFPMRKDGTPTTINSVPMELLYYDEGSELTFRFLTGNHLIFRFFYQATTPKRTQFIVNVLVGAESPFFNTLRQRFSARSRRKRAIKDHTAVRAQIQARAGQRK